MTGTFTLPARFPDGQRELTITKAGMSATGQFGQGSVSLNPLGGRVGMGGPTSDLFKRVSCSGRTCAFTTKEGCEGSFTKTESGDMDVVANGACSGFSGHWRRSAS